MGASYAIILTRSTVFPRIVTLQRASAFFRHVIRLTGDPNRATVLPDGPVVPAALDIAVLEPK
jgi:hypothetical protein